MSFLEAKTILSLAEQQREELALKVFGYEAVAALVKEAATRGENGLRIAQDEPIDLRATKAAKSLCSKLEEGGFKLRWVEATQKEICNGRETSCFLVFYELAISWGAVNRRGIQNEAPE